MYVIFYTSSDFTLFQLFCCNDFDLVLVLALALLRQPRSQALSPLPPFVVGRRTLVAAGHVTTQNLGGKKICWVGGVAEYFNCCCGKFCGFQNLEQSLKKLPALSGSKSDFADEEGYIISADSKI